MERPTRDAPDSTRFEHYAIVVGIDRYPALRDLRGACRDAEAVYDWLIDPLGGRCRVDDVRVHLGREAADARSARPKKWEIDADIDDLVATVRDGDPRQRTRLTLYFAGHGIAAGVGTGAWLMADAKRNLFTNLAVAPYQQWLERCRDFDEVVICSDCCRTFMVDVQETPQPHSICTEPSVRDQQIFIAHATEIGDAAYEERLDDEARGHFTVALLDGLRGGAAEGGEVRAPALAAHLRKRVTEMSRGRQHAQIRMDDRMVLARTTTGVP